MRFFLLIIGLSLYFSLGSRAEDFLVDRILVFKADDAREICNYSFNNENQIITKKTDTLIGNTWINNERNTNLFDNQGNKLVEKLEKWDNDSWIILTRVSSTFDNNNNHLKLLHEYQKDGKLEKTSGFEKFYDENNKCTL